jgi:uncharacterized protein YjbI with pentapeptide repeats
MKDNQDHIDTLREYLTYIGKAIGDRGFQSDLERAGSIAALIGFGIRLYKDVKEQAQSKDERAFNLLIKAAFESAEESIPESVGSTISLGYKSKDTKKELFNIFITTRGWDYYLPSHPVIKQFKSLFRQILESEGHTNLVRDFILDFNKHLEDKMDDDLDLVPFKEKIDDIERKSNLLNHLEYTGTLIYKINEMDKKCLADYYIENNAVKADIFDEWDKEDADYLPYIDRENEKEVLLTPASKAVMDSVSNSMNPYTLVGAPFGIGKTSLSLHLSSVYAQQYLDDPDRDNRYIPVFAPLKDSLDNINEKGESLEDVLELIAPVLDRREARKKKIIVICDGLDEYPSNNTHELKTRLDTLRRKDKYPNIKFVITTRLEADIPEDFKTAGLKTYLRLLPFSKNQVDDFFRKSKLPQYSFERFKMYDPVREGYGGIQKNTLGAEIRKPLFCWMFALMVNSDSDNARIIEDATTTDLQLRTALIYQEFIHSIIKGKHEESAKEYFYKQRYPEEKNLLRKIAALKQKYKPDTLKESLLATGLRDYYGLNYNKEDLRRNPIVTSYFYLKGTTTTDKTVGFIHKSFMEHLLAEYYIESTALGHDIAKYYLNIVGIPSAETIQHLSGLLALVNSENVSFNKQLGTFVASLQQRSRSDLRSSLITSAKRIFEAEEIIVLQRDKLDQDRNKILLATRVPPHRYSYLWIHRWIALYILNTLAPDECNFDKQMLSEFIVYAPQYSPRFLRRLVKVNLTQANLLQVNLSAADLTGANLSGANLAQANLRDTNLTNANLRDANLTGANLSGAKLLANLTEANLSGTNLWRADLSRANLSGADLRGASLVRAHLTGANLTKAILKAANLSQADLSGSILKAANLSQADLSGSILEGSDITGANLSQANLTGASLIKATLNEANLSQVSLPGAKLLQAALHRARLIRSNLSAANLSAANLSQVDLTAANLSSANLSLANLSGVDLTAANLSSANLSQANLSGARLTRANLTRANLKGTKLSQADLSGVDLRYTEGLDGSDEAKSRGAFI